MRNIKLNISEPKSTPLFLPDWCNTHCYKMKPTLNLSKKILLIHSGTSALTITLAEMEFIKGWFVDWHIIHTPWSKSGGRIIMESMELKSAFGLTGESGDDGKWLLESYGGDSAAQGKYIRWGNYLNIPCPGTSHDGDPNISIKIDEPIKYAVKTLLSAGT